ncbi:MAG: nitrite/sulfite reductase [Verrucomicrobia bacterium]|nr:nitrite/sulfite reductase [Verrucomicrobiota bacterium]
MPEPKPHVNFAAAKANAAVGGVKPDPFEQIKLAKDGLDIVHDIFRYAKMGFEAITPDDLKLFKWYGVYTQRPESEGYFMMRLKVPAGQVTSAQARVIAGIANDYGRGFLDVTTRQTYQMHWLRVEQLPDIFARLASVGMTTSGACGDITRNVVGCPAAGLDRDEILDATGFTRAVDDHLTHNREFSNLPRKFKFSVSGCHIHCAQPDINCVGIFALRRKSNGQAGFGIKVGGGLSTAPHMAQLLPVFIPPVKSELIEVVHHIAALYRDEGYRDAGRRVARLKFLVADWGAERFAAELEKRLGRKLEPFSAADYDEPEDPESDHFGVHEQKQAGLYYVGISCLGGRISTGHLLAITELSEKFGSGEIRNTNKQNILIPNIPKASLDALLKELTARGLVWEASSFRRGCVSCTGIEFCKLAVAETKNRAMWLVEQLEKARPGYSDKIRIHFSGCPNNCGQSWIADIGLRGALTRVDGKQVEAFDLFTGDQLGRNRAFNKLLKGKIPANALPAAITKLLDVYQARRNAGESFQSFVLRMPKDDLLKAME